MIRQNGREYQVYTIDDIDYSVFPVKDGDKVTAEAILNRFENKLEIKGAVYRPGIYQLELIEYGSPVGEKSRRFDGRCVYCPCRVTS